MFFIFIFISICFKNDEKAFENRFSDEKTSAILNLIINNYSKNQKNKQEENPAGEEESCVSRFQGQSNLDSHGYEIHGRAIRLKKSIGHATRFLLAFRQNSFQNHFLFSKFDFFLSIFKTIRFRYGLEEHATTRPLPQDHGLEVLHFFQIII